MRQWTKAEIIEKVENDLDLRNEEFISDDEMDGYLNEAVDECEAEIHNIYEDYFLTQSDVSVIPGTNRYALPADIYANKIRRVTIPDGAATLTLRRSKNLGHLESSGIGGRPEQYTLINPTPLAGGPVGSLLVLLPAPSTASTLTVHYLRNAQRLVADTDVCDIPEFINFVIQFMKFRCYEKEGHPNAQLAAQALQKQRELMINTLSEMVPDDDSFIPGDLSHYMDHT